jgi:hypothetical protein
LNHFSSELEVIFLTELFFNPIIASDPYIN